jgi:hypothetical protein
VKIIVSKNGHFYLLAFLRFDGPDACGEKINWVKIMILAMSFIVNSKNKITKYCFKCSVRFCNLNHRAIEI